MSLSNKTEVENILVNFMSERSESGQNESLYMNNNFSILNTSLLSLYENRSNLTFLNETDFYENPHVLPWWQQLVWIILFGSMVVVATGGNLIVIWIVLTDKRMRTVTNIFLVNLSVADAMVSSMNVLFTFIYMLSGHWPFGWLYCKISQFVAVLSISASVFTLMAISFDRYIAIIYPLRPRMGSKATLCIVGWIWVASATVAAPNFAFYKTELLPLKEGGEWIVCYSNWPDGPQTESYIEYIHTVVLMILTYVLPMLSMGFTYMRMGLMLWGSGGLGDLRTPNYENAIRSKRKVVKMMIVVVTIFGVCWLPFHLYFILVTQMPNLNEFEYTQDIYLGIYWLAMSNSMYNPMIYCWLNGRFRTGFKRVLSNWLPCIKCLHVSTTGKRCQTTHMTMFSTSGSPEALNKISGSERANLRAFLGHSTKRQQSILSGYPTSPSNTNHSNASSRSTITTRSTTSQLPCNDSQYNRLSIAPNGVQTIKASPSHSDTTPV